MIITLVDQVIKDTIDKQPDTKDLSVRDKEFLVEKHKKSLFSNFQQIPKYSKTT